MALSRAFRLDRAALTGSSSGGMHPCEGVRVEGIAGDGSFAQEQLGNRDHRDQCDHREPRKTVAECGSAMSNA